MSYFNTENPNLPKPGDRKSEGRKKNIPKIKIVFPPPS
jgi:hypothetical protein